MRKVRGSTPVVLQAEQTECGLASLAMIANQFGHRFDLATLRRRFAHLNQGPSLRSILSIADALGLIARPVRLGLADLRRLVLPAIVHWRFDHFVVLIRVRRRSVLIHDPAVGRRSISMQEFGESFTGVAVEFARARHFTAESSSAKPLLLGLLRSFDGLTPYLVMMLVLLLVTQTLALAPPIATQLLIDDVVLGKDSGWLYQVLAGIALVMLTMLVIDTLRRWIALYASTRLATESTTAVVRHLLHLPIRTIVERPVGDLLSRIDSLQPIRAAILGTFLQGFVQLVIVMTTLAVMIFYSSRLTLLSVAALALIVCLHLATLPAMRALNMESVVTSAQASNSLIETLRSFHSVRTLGLDAQRLAHWQRSFVQTTNAGARQARISIAASFGQGLVTTAEQLTFLALGIGGVVSKQLTIGILFAFLSLRGRLSAAAIGLIATLRELYLLRSHLQRVGELVAEEPECQAAVGAIRERIDGAIVCRGICFRYAGGEEVLSQFDCDIEAGESVLISGPSGAGKSTLLQLMCGGLRPSSGMLLFDGLEADLWDLQSLRRQFGVVLQQDRLLQGSIADNISGFEVTPDIGRVRAAACIACIWEDIAALPMQAHTPIADSGSGFSGGQLQRILLARALYRRPRILFLDEATCHLDGDTESRVLDNLDTLDTTIISVAHRDSVLRRGGRVLRLVSNGR